MVTLPAEFATRMKRMLGEEYPAYRDSLAEERVRSLRVNTAKISAEELARTAGEFCPQVLPAQTCGEAVARAMKAMGPGDALIVCGSFYLAGEIRDQLKGKLANLQPDRLPQKM